MLSMPYFIMFAVLSDRKEQFLYVTISPSTCEIVFDRALSEATPEENDKENESPTGEKDTEATNS